MLLMCLRYLTSSLMVILAWLLCRAVSTATVYFRRFYLNNTFLEYDPCCVAPACLYLACKAEESQVQAKLLYHLQTKLQQNGKISNINSVPAAAAAIKLGVQ